MAESVPLPADLLALAWQRHPHPQLIVDASGRIAQVNDRLAAVVGRPAASLAGERLDALCGQPRGSLDGMALRAGAHAMTPLALTLGEASGGSWWLESCDPLPGTSEAEGWMALSLRPVDDGDHWARMHQQVLDGLHDGVLLCDDQGRFLAANRAAEQMLGLSVVEMRGRRVQDMNWMRYRLDGSTGDIREVVDPEDRVRLKAAFAQSAMAMKPLREEFRVTHPKLGPLWVEMHVTPVREPEGVIAWHGFLHDITSRKQVEAEIRRVNLELEGRVAERTAELEARNKEMEAFSYSVSHDLKAPLRGIDGYSRLLLTDHADALNEEGRFFVDTIRKATVHMGRLIDDLLAYSRVERSRPTLAAIDPADVVQKVLASLKREMDDGQVELQLTLDCHQAVGEREGLTMAVRNLLDNALKFTHGRSPRCIQVRCVAEGGRCLIEVQDNGPGFDMRYHDRIFEIFQRLHRAEDYPGTGVGLAIVRKAMERMRGRVWASSTPGQGACFSLELPLPA